MIFLSLGCLHAPYSTIPNAALDGKVLDKIKLKSNVLYLQKLLGQMHWLPWRGLNCSTHTTDLSKEKLVEHLIHDYCTSAQFL